MSHDQLFKELLQAFLPEFVELFLPAEAAQLDWSSTQFLDKEVFTDLGEGSRRAVDLVARVRTKLGQPEILLVHVEIEADPRGDFPSRMYDYYAMLRLKFRLPVLPVAVFLRPGFGGIGKGSYTESVLGLRVLDFEYHQIALPDVPYANASPSNPVTHALAPLLRDRPPDPVELVFISLNGITLTAADEARQELLTVFLSAYAPLSAEQDADLTTRLADNQSQEVQRMLTIWHQRGHEAGRLEGLEEGRVEGIRHGIMRALRRRFDHLPATVVTAIQRITDETQLDDLMDAAITADSIEEFQARLPLWARK
ncbi:MAG: Rpn family recombination-promoting nuclease/putative transposase [Actinomycetota bacterium]